MPTASGEGTAQRRNHRPSLGKIVVAGWTDATGTDASFLVLRYRTDGTLDPGFADCGRFVLPISASNGADRAHAVAVQDHSRIVVGGTPLAGTCTTGQDFALVRLLPDGQLDTGFGQGCEVVTPMQAQRRPGGPRPLPAVIGGQQRILAGRGEGDFAPRQLVSRWLVGGNSLDLLRPIGPLNLRCMRLKP